MTHDNTNTDTTTQELSDDDLDQIQGGLYSYSTYHRDDQRAGASCLQGAWHDHTDDVHCQN